MGRLVLLLAVVAAVYLWIRQSRIARQRWLARLALPGVWSSDTEAGDVTVEFQGEPDHGSYVETDRHTTERGRWRIEGSQLWLSSESGERAYELRLFADGSIGVDGPGRERRVYVRRRNNVVPLRQRR
jgi:hypothetical protein